MKRILDIIMPLFWVFSFLSSVLVSIKKCHRQAASLFLGTGRSPRKVIYDAKIQDYAY